MSDNKVAPPTALDLEVEVKLQNEVVKRDQHQLNYEKLKALNSRLEMQTLQIHGAGDAAIKQIMECAKTSGRQNLLKSPTVFTLPTNVPETHFGRHVVKLVFENEIQQLKKSLEKLGQQHNPAIKSKQAWTKVVSQREKDYHNLFQQFEEFQSSMSTFIRSEITAAAEKVSNIEEENKSMRIEFEKQKIKWSKTNRELTRDKICNECEIRTLRDQLDESRRNFLEKSNLCDALNREIDHLKTPVPPRNQEMFDEAVPRAQLENQLRTEQSRNSFLENEIQTLSTNNEQLLKEIQGIHEQNHSTVIELNAKIHKLELSIVRDLEDYELKQKALKELITAHEACISEMDQHLRAKEDEKEEIMLNARDHVKTFVDESMKTIKDIETENHAMATTQLSLNQELAAVKQILSRSKEGVKSHQKLVIQMCKQGLAQFSNFGISSPKSTTQDLNNNEENDNTDNTNSLAENVLLAEEAMLEKLIESVMNVTTQFKSQQENLQTRILELENVLKSCKLQHAEEFGKLQKKCKKYGQLILKLRSRAAPQLEGQLLFTERTASNLQKKPKLIRRLTTIPSKPMKPQNFDKCPILTSFQEKHEHFEIILANISNTNL